MEKKLLKVAEIRNMYLCEKRFEEYSDTYTWECGFIDETTYLQHLFSNQSKYSDYDKFARDHDWSTCHYGKWGRIGVPNPIIGEFEMLDDFDSWDYTSNPDSFLTDIRKATRNLDAYVDGHGNWISVSSFPTKQAFRKSFIRELLKNADHVFVYECEPSQFA